MKVTVKAFARFRETIGKEYQYMQALYISTGFGDLNGKLRSIKIFISYVGCSQS